MTGAGTSASSLAVVVVSYNVRDLLRACLSATFASLARASELKATVHVVDNASGDGSAEMVARDFPQTHLTASPNNLGFAGGNNLVLRQLGFGTPAAPAFALLLNPDAEPLGDAIGQMARFLQERGDVGAAGARLQYADGSFQHGAFAFPGLLQLWFDLFPPRPRRLLDTPLNGRYPRALYDAGKPFPVDFALGAALMVRREAIASAGLLDEGYFMYAEEVDWCWRMRRTGWPCFCVPSARVIHHGGASSSQFRSQSMQNLWRSRKRLYERFYGPLKRSAAEGIVRLGMAAEKRRAQAAATPAERDERVSAADAVVAMFGGRAG
jgi:N-acetylglucosaminyl-diphospho-decaprenol L-rhamnosyltransferase